MVAPIIAQAWQAFKARPPTARLQRFYVGGFQPTMTKREAGIRKSTPAIKDVKGAPKKLTSHVGKTAGRNSAGRITIFHRGGGAKRLYRRIDMKRSTSSMGVIERIEYDPNRSSRIALVRWVEGAHLRFQKKCKAVEEEFVPPPKVLEPTTTTPCGLFSLASLSMEVDQRKIACSPSGLAAAYAVVGLQTGMPPGSKTIKGAESKKTCVRDVFLSAFSTSRAKRETAPFALSGSLNVPRIAVAGAKPSFFAPQIGEKDAGKSTFSLSEIQKLNPQSVLWANRSKRKAAVSWQSFRWQDALGFVGDANCNKSKA
ncbi:mitochondrial 60S ribosomal protein L2, putative [Ricinus communis]|uniref:60S ribosomal protein L2, mitochondrial n=1 Tax=Ricinus communis TaxID=3988 RepID=B9SGQ7_RICCO|nr:mitochondrial 60S ribosomal protein L2, putative [Ricinus communis]